MEREKMIEEMAKVTCGYKVHCKNCKKVHPSECADRSFATMYIDAGYRKIPEGAVVLTKEELIKAVEEGYIYDTTKGNKINIIEMAREQARKETAQKIYNEIKSNRYVGIFIEPFMINYSTVVKVCEKYGANTKEVDE